jgi:hypothetical protein
MHKFAQLAQKTANQYIRKKEKLHLSTSLAPDYVPQRACFINIYDKPGRRLRTTYGTTLPRQPSLAEEIINNTISALKNNRGRKVSQADLSSISFSVAVLGPLQRVSGIFELDPQKYGIFVSSQNNKSATLLPQRPGIITPQDQLATALREANIKEYQEIYTIYRFNVEYYT